MKRDAVLLLRKPMSMYAVTRNKAAPLAYYSEQLGDVSLENYLYYVRRMKEASVIKG